MKKIILLVLLLSFSNFFAQGKVAQEIERLVADGTVFKNYSVLTEVNQFSNKEYQKVVNNAALATINSAVLSEIVRNRFDNIELSIPYHNEDIIVQLYKVNIFSEGFHVDTDQKTNVHYGSGVHYRGIIKGQSNSIVSFNFFSGEMNGIISSSELSNLVVAKLDKRGNKSDYIIYEDQNLTITPNFQCGTEDKVTESLESHRNPNETESTASFRCVRMYIEIDYNLYQSNGSSVFTATNWISSVFNNMKTLYANDGITVALKSVFIWTTNDPYTGGSSSDYRDAFGALRPNFDGDVGSLLGIDPGGLGGVAASIGNMCGGGNYSYSDVDFSFSTVPVYSWTVQVATHENGHVLGSPHTHACFWGPLGNTAIDNCGPSSGQTPEGANCMTTPPTIPSASVKGSIMSYCHLVSGIGISFNNGFGTQPGGRIVNVVNSSSCLTTNCFGACVNNISNINVTQLTATSVQITWADDNSTTNWIVSVDTPGNPFPNAEVVSTKSYIAIDLAPNQEYSITITPICSQNLTTSASEYTFVNGNLGIKDNTFTDLKYYPNPTKDFVQISSRDEISEIYVYNIEGRLLYQSKSKTNNTRVDISAFASGTYFFKLKGENKESNFKVLKM